MLLFSVNHIVHHFIQETDYSVLLPWNVFRYDYEYVSTFDTINGI